MTPPDEHSVFPQQWQQTAQVFALCEAGLISYLRVSATGKILDAPAHLWEFFEGDPVEQFPSELWGLVPEKEWASLHDLLASLSEQRQPRTFSATICIPQSGEARHFPCQCLALPPFAESHTSKVERQWAPFPLRFLQEDCFFLFIAPSPVAAGLSADQVRAHRLSNLGAMAAGMAHDINNLVTGGMTFTSLLEQRLQDQQELAYLHLLQKTFEKTTQVSQSLLNFIRDEESDAGPVNPLTVIRDIALMMERSLPEGITLSLSLPAKTYPVQIGHAALAQAALNLLINARDAVHPQGAIRIQAAFTPQDAPREFVLEIIDDGSGIAPENQEKIFTPLFTTKAEQGTGLGLAIVKQSIEGAGGTVSVQSTPGSDTCFTLTLPVLQSESGPLQKLREQSLSFHSLAPGSQQPVRLMLQQDGFQVQDLDRENPDHSEILVIDAVNDTQGALGLWRQIQPSRCIICSTESSPEITERNVVFLQKPFNVVQLREALLRCRE